MFSNKRKGLTLIELMIAISILIMGMAGFSMLFIQSWKANKFIIEEGQSSTQATRSVNKISAQLREVEQSETGEYLIRTADENELVVYMDIDDDDSVERVRYYLDETNDLLLQGVAEAAGSPLAYPSGYSSDEVSTLASYVSNDSISEPVFKYYDGDNSSLAVPATPTDIRIIELNLWINIKPNTAPDNVKMGTSIMPRSLDESI